MATTMEQLAALLRADGRKYLMDVDGEQIVCRAEGAHGRWEVEVRLSEAGECCHFRIPRVVSVGTSPHVGLLFARILELHFQIKLGRFGFDPADGEVDCEIILPLDDAPLTARQLRRCLNALLQLVDLQVPRFRHILATGEDPAENEEQHTEALLDQIATVLGMSRQQLDAHLAAQSTGDGGQEPL